MFVEFRIASIKNDYTTYTKKQQQQQLFIIWRISFLIHGLLIKS